MSNFETSGRLVFTCREAAAQLGLSEKSIQRLIKAGKLASVRISNRVRIPADKLREFASTGHPERIRK